MPFHPKTRTALQALGRLKTGQMNKLETAYSQLLDNWMMSGKILWYKFEGMKFRLADNTFFTPDFCVMMADSSMELHECKGYMMDDANVKLKLCASLFPFPVFIIRANAKKDGGGFSKTEV